MVWKSDRWQSKIEAVEIDDAYRRRAADDAAPADEFAIEIAYRRGGDAAEKKEYVFEDPEDTKQPRLLVSLAAVTALKDLCEHEHARYDKVVETLRSCRSAYYKELRWLRDQMHLAYQTDEESKARKESLAPDDFEVYWFEPQFYLDPETREFLLSCIRETNKKLIEENRDLRSQLQERMLLDSEMAATVIRQLRKDHSVSKILKELRAQLRTSSEISEFEETCRELVSGLSSSATITAASPGVIESAASACEESFAHSLSMASAASIKEERDELRQKLEESEALISQLRAQLAGGINAQLERERAEAERKRADLISKRAERLELQHRRLQKEVRETSTNIGQRANIVQRSLTKLSTALVCLSPSGSAACTPHTSPKRLGLGCELPPAGQDDEAEFDEALSHLDDIATNFDAVAQEVLTELNELRNRVAVMEKSHGGAVSSPVQSPTTERIVTTVHTIAEVPQSSSKRENSKIASLEKQVLDLMADLEQERARNSKLKSDLKEAQNTNEVMGIKIIKLKNRIDKLKAQLRSLKCGGTVDDASESSEEEIDINDILLPYRKRAAAAVGKARWELLAEDAKYSSQRRDHMVSKRAAHVNAQHAQKAHHQQQAAAAFQFLNSPAQTLIAGRPSVMESVRNLQAMQSGLSGDPRLLGEPRMKSRDPRRPSKSPRPSQSPVRPASGAVVPRSASRTPQEPRSASRSPQLAETTASWSSARSGTEGGASWSSAQTPPRMGSCASGVPAQALRTGSPAIPDAVQFAEGCHSLAMALRREGSRTLLHSMSQTSLDAGRRTLLSSMSQGALGDHALKAPGQLRALPDTSMAEALVHATSVDRRQLVPETWTPPADGGRQDSAVGSRQVAPANAEVSAEQSAAALDMPPVEAPPTDADVSGAPCGSDSAEADAASLVEGDAAGSGVAAAAAAHDASHAASSGVTTAPPSHAASSGVAAASAAHDASHAASSGVASARDERHAASPGVAAAAARDASRGVAAAAAHDASSGVAAAAAARDRRLAASSAAAPARDGRLAGFAAAVAHDGSHGRAPSSGGAAAPAHAAGAQARDSHAASSSPPSREGHAASSGAPARDASLGHAASSGAPAHDASLGHVPSSGAPARESYSASACAPAPHAASVSVEEWAGLAAAPENSGRGVPERRSPKATAAPRDGAAAALPSMASGPGPRLFGAPPAAAHGRPAAGGSLPLLTAARQTLRSPAVARPEEEASWGAGWERKPSRTEPAPSLGASQRKVTFGRSTVESFGQGSWLGGRRGGAGASLFTNAPAPVAAAARSGSLKGSRSAAEVREAGRAKDGLAPPRSPPQGEAMQKAEHPSWYIPCPN